MKLLLTGRNGQVGWELARSLMPLGEVIAVDRVRCDLSRPKTLAALVRDCRPDVIVNAAAYTAVDKAQQEETLAMAINAAAADVLAHEARKAGALLVHYSTDYVFDGAKASPYVEDDTPNPLNAYGRSKLAGENAIRASNCDHIILRTSWVYAARGHNFVKTILRLARERDVLNIVADQFGAPTSARMIADTTAHLIRHVQSSRARATFASATYHLTAAGATSWHGYAQSIVQFAARKGLIPATRTVAINPIATSAYPLPAVRPANSRLDCGKVQHQFGIALAGWAHALERVLEEMAGN